VSNLLNGSLQPGTATNLPLSFKASSHGTAVGTMTFQNNEANAGTFSLYLVGNALLPGEGPWSSTNVPPVAVDDEFTVLANSQNNILKPLANDYDTNGDTLTIIATTGSDGGTLAIVDGGRAVSYTPPHGYRSNPGEPGDGFYYEISDGKGGTNWGKAEINLDASDIPDVIIISPLTGYTTNAGALMPIVAAVSNSPNIVRVEFYLGKDKIGETNGTGPLYTLNWRALYDDCDCNVTAVATDKFGQGEHLRTHPHLCHATSRRGKSGGGSRPNRGFFRH